VGKIARRQPAARLSRSGLWLIGGALLLSVAVLAWALQGDGGTGRWGDRATGRPSGSMSALAGRPVAPSPPRPLALPASRSRPARAQTTVEELAERPPSVGDYEALLRGNVFQPRVIPIRDRGARSGSPSGQAASASRRQGAGADPEVTDAWHDWKYTGIAELDQQAYALMDQPDKKQSQFVKVGDRLEDATIVSVSENEVTLREAGGSVVRMKRVDPVADQLRSLRAAPAAPAATAPGSLSPALIPGQGTMAPFPNGQVAPPQPAAGYNSPAGGAFGRRSRRSQQDGAGDAGVQ
jgi:hypothetical protein